jgi:hypothetical protein
LVPTLIGRRQVRTANSRRSGADAPIGVLPRTLLDAPARFQGPILGPTFTTAGPNTILTT